MTIIKMNSILRSIILSLLLFIAGDIMAQIPLTQSRIDTIDSFVERTCSRWNIPGMTFVLIKNDSIVTCKNFGVLEKRKSDKVNCKTNFRLSSMSKSFTAIAVLQLAQKGLINLNAPVINYLPMFASRDSERSDRITVSQLLSHTSGIPRNAFGLQLAGGTEKDEYLQVKQLKKIKLTANPGEHFEYSDFNFYVLQALVSHCAKEPFVVYMEKNVFRQMGMLRTGYYDSVSVYGNLATGHNPRKDIFQPLYYTNPYTINGGDGVYSNGEDMARYIRFLTNNGSYGNDTVLSEKYFSKLFQDHAKANYGYGWCVKHEHHTLQIQHSGESPNYTSEIYVYPEKKLGFVILCNAYDNVAYQMAKNIDDYLFDGVLNEITTTNKETRVKETHTIRIISLLLSMFIILYVAVYIRLRYKGRIRLMKPFHLNVVSLLKLILPVCVGLLTAYIAVKNITVTSGSIYLSKIYEPDLVESALHLLLIINIIMLLIVITLFTRKTISK